MQASTLLGWLSWARLALRGPRWALARSCSCAGAEPRRRLVLGRGCTCCEWTVPAFVPTPQRDTLCTKKARGWTQAGSESKARKPPAPRSGAAVSCALPSAGSPSPHKPRPHHKPGSRRPPGVSTWQLLGTLVKTKPTSTDISSSFAYRTLVTTSRNTCHSFTDGETEVQQFLECLSRGHTLRVLEQGPQDGVVSPPWDWGWTETPSCSAGSPGQRRSAFCELLCKTR